jgi:hypothetical protein
VLDGVADSEVAGSLLEEGVHLLLHLLCAFLALYAFSLSQLKITIVCGIIIILNIHLIRLEARPHSFT